MNRRTMLTTVAVLGIFGADATYAAEFAASSSRTQLIVVRKGGSETTGYRTVPDLATTDRIVFLLLGSGHATLTLTDADETGDTLTVNGTFSSAQPVEFQASATSPNQIVKTLPVNMMGVLTIDVGYSSVVNGLPARYAYKLQF